MTNIIFEHGNRFIIKKGEGHFEVYENGITHAKRVAIVHYASDPVKAYQQAEIRCKATN